MRVIEAVAARLDQSIKMAANLGVELTSTDPSSESQLRNAVWHCIFCRHGSECAEWVDAGVAGVPSFCRNREFYFARARDGG